MTQSVYQGRMQFVPDSRRTSQRSDLVDMQVADPAYTDLELPFTCTAAIWRKHISTEVDGKPCASKLHDCATDCELT